MIKRIFGLSILGIVIGMLTGVMIQLLGAPVGISDYISLSLIGAVGFSGFVWGPAIREKFSW